MNNDMPTPGVVIPPIGFGDLNIKRVSNDGTVIGSVFDSTTGIDDPAIIYKDGVFNKVIPPLPNLRSSFLDIDLEDDTIVGWIYYPRTGCIYKNGVLTIVDIPIGCDEIYYYGICNNVIVGIAEHGTLALIYKDSQYTFVSPQSGCTSLAFRGIDKLLNIYGEQFTQDGTRVPFIYKDFTFINCLIPNAYLSGINNGVAVGDVNYTNGLIFDINGNATLIDPPPGYAGVTFTNINGDGKIVGDCYSSDYSINDCCIYDKNTGVFTILKSNNQDYPNLDMYGISNNYVCGNAYDADWSHGVLFISSIIAPEQPSPEQPEQQTLASEGISTSVIFGKCRRLLVQKLGFNPKYMPNMKAALIQKLGVNYDK